MSEQPPPRFGELVVNLEPEPHQTPTVAKTSSVVLHEQTASGTDLPERVNAETHPSQDMLLKGELKEGTIDNEPDIIFEAIPREGVPFDGEELFPALTDAKNEGLPFYSEGRWQGFPGHQGKSITAYIERLAMAIHAALLKASPEARRRFWTDMFQDEPVNHPSCKRKPDGAQISDDPEGLTAKTGPGWDGILSTAEFKKNLKDRLIAIFQLAGSARMIFNAQLDRRYVVGYTLTDDWMSVVVLDRSGWVASKPFNIHRNPGLFLHVAVGSLYLDESKYGLDPTLRMRGDKKEIELDGEWYEIVEVIHLEGVLRGRATICYHVRKDGEDYIVKDSWIDVSRKDREADILEKLKGSKHVPEVVKSVPVQFNGKTDSTAYFRKNTKDGKIGNVEIREHWRMLLKPRARKLTDFRDLVELLTAIRDIVDGIEEILEVGYIHRDISISNVMLKVEGDELRGLLIDYDYAIHIARAEKVAIGRRTGTLPFMAIDILYGKSSTIHKYYHDLESLFYVLIWVCTMQNGPCGEQRNETFDYNKTVLSMWNGGLHSTVYTFESVAMAKKSIMHDPVKFKEDILDNFAPYFDPIKTCLEQFRRILWPPGIAKEDARTIKDALDQESPLKKMPELSTILRKFIPHDLSQPATVFKAIRSIFDDKIEELCLNNHANSRGPIPPPAPLNPGGAFHVLHPVDCGDEKAYHVVDEPGDSYGITCLSGNELVLTKGRSRLKRHSGSDGLDDGKGTGSKRLRSLPSPKSPSSFVVVSNSRRSISSFQFVSPEDGGEDDVFSPSYRPKASGSGSGDKAK